jgi:glycosyltransferase involved in cell wall biosynthesis
MRKPILTIFYQFDPWRSTIGGIQTLIGSFIKYAPVDVDIRLVGITHDPRLAVGQWHSKELLGRELLFMPLFYLQNDDVRHLVPTTIKYLLALTKCNLASDFMHFHRLEPTMATQSWVGHKTLFVHNDITQQFANSGGKRTILWRRFPTLYYALEQQLVKQFARVLSCNSQSLTHYKDKYPQLADRFDYVSNSVDTEIFYPLTDVERDLHRRQYAHRLNLAENTEFVLFAGRLHPQKDPLLLIRAFAQLTEPNTHVTNTPLPNIHRLSNIHLLMVGDGELAPQVRSEIERLNLTRQVSMLGTLSREEVANLHRISNVCALTSEFEGLPLVALEALACGTPLMTTRTGDTPLLLTPKSGLVCEERTPDGVAQALQNILLHRSSFPAAECARVAQPFAAANVIGRIYADLLTCWHAQQAEHPPVMSLLKTPSTTHS